MEGISRCVLIFFLFRLRRVHQEDYETNAGMKKPLIIKLDKLDKITMIFREVLGCNLFKIFNIYQKNKLNKSSLCF